MLPDIVANEFASICRVFSVIAAKIRLDIPAVDISDVMDEVSALLDHSIATQGYVIKPAATTAIIGAVAVILGLWIVAFEVNRVGNALWQIQADLHDIRCSIYTVGEPANTLLRAQVENRAAANRPENSMMKPG